jgi:cytoskeleton protein RodZ
MPETIGKQLKQAREAKNLTIEKIVVATRIRAHLIEAIEADDFESLPSPVQARAFLRLYAEFLGLSLEDIIARQRPEVDKQPSTALDPAIAVVGQKSEVSSKNFNLVLKRLKTIGERVRTILVRSLQKSSHQIEDHLVVEPLEKSNQSTIYQEIKDQPVALLELTRVPSSEVLQSQATFSTIGSTLTQRREALSLNLDEIEQHTHIGKHYLQALEAGELYQLPSSVQARGMLSNYAHFLGLNVDAILLTFAEGLQIQLLERKTRSDDTFLKPISKFPFNLSSPSKFRIPSALRLFLSVDIFVGGGLVLLLLVFAVWGTNRIINLRSGVTPQPTAPSISNFLVSTSEVATVSPTTSISGIISTLTIPTADETMVLTLPATGPGPVQVVVVAQDQAWVRVTVDGKVKFEGRVTAGTAYSFDGITQIEVLTGNGRAISILYNQNDLGPMGNIGEVVDRIYTTTVILNPTATFTPTPTITPTPTATIKPTITLRPSNTPRPSTTPRPSPTPTK